MEELIPGKLYKSSMLLPVFKKPLPYNSDGFGSDYDFYSDKNYYLKGSICYEHTIFLLLEIKEQTINDYYVKWYRILYNGIIGWIFHQGQEINNKKIPLDVFQEIK